MSSFDDTHTITLPKRLAAGWGARAARQTHALTPLALRLPDGRGYVYEPNESGIEILPGEEAETVVELAESDWSGLFESTETVFGLIMAGRARILAGRVEDFVGWQTALRMLYEELPAYDPDAPLHGGDGREIDPGRSFRADDDPIEMADFLRVTGYIHVRELLSPDEVSGLREAAETARAAAREDDGQSWWSTHQDGRRLLTRVLNAGTDPRMKALPTDPRLLRIVGLSDYELEPTETEGVSVLFKQSGMVFDGKADQPWHRDCGLGGHKLMCPLMNGSLFLSEGNRETGELRFLPGSWQTAGCLIDEQDFELGIAVETRPGDFTLHYGDGLHAGTPPTSVDGPFRSSVVFEYGPVGRRPEQSQEYYDQLMHQADARALHTDPTAD